MVNHLTIYVPSLSFVSTSPVRKATKRVILHHAAGRGSVYQIHKSHLNNGWSGIGYHFYITRDGKIWQGRQLDRVGAHCLNSNSDSIGICFEGNMQKENQTISFASKSLMSSKRARELIPFSSVDLSSAFPSRKSMAF